MNFLFQKVKIVDPTSSFHGKRMDVLVKRGKIEKIDKAIEAKGVEIISVSGALLSPGWLDIGTQIGEPGFEHRDDIQSTALAAMRGGYTALAPFPNTEPVIDNRSMITYLKSLADDVAIDIYPIGAISQKTNGQDISEIVDMHHAGAVAFSDGANPVNNEGLLTRALQYGKRVNALIIDQPCNTAEITEAQVHEGRSSTMMGLKGMPVMSEVYRIKRNLELSRYTDSPICLHLISSGEGADKVKNAKKKGLSVSASVSAYHLAYNEQDVLSFDPNLKLYPPLRSANDRNRLVRSVDKGHIDVIVSQHIPLEEEKKETAFFDADPGVISLQTTFALLASKVPELSPEKLVGALCHAPRRLLNINIPSLEVGNEFNATLFHPKKKWSFDQTVNASKSKNTSHIGQQFEACVIGAFNKGKAVWNVEIK